MVSSDDPSASALATCRWPRNQSNQCGKSVKTSMSKRIHSPRKARSTSMRRARHVDRPDRVADHRHEQLAAAVRAHDLERLARRQRDHAPHLADQAARRRTPRSPRARAPSTRRAPARARARPGPRAGRRAAPRRPRGRRARRAGGSGGRRCRRGARSAPAARRRGSRRTTASSRATGRVTWKEPSSPCGRPTRPASIAGRCHSTMSTSTRRLSLTAAAFTTVRSAWAVRPPRPMTWP